MDIFNDKNLPANIGDVLEMKVMDSVGNSVERIERRTISKISHHNNDLYLIEYEEPVANDLLSCKDIVDAKVICTTVGKSKLYFGKIQDRGLIQLASLYCTEEGIEVTQDYYKNICNVNSEMNNKGDYVFGAFDSNDNGKLVGAVTVHYMLDLYPKYDKAPYCHLETIIVAKSHQNNGVGTALLTEVIRQLKNEGVTYIIAQTATDNLAMQKVYERLDMEPSNNYTLNFVESHENN